MIILRFPSFPDDGTEKAEAENRPTQHPLNANHGNERSTVTDLHNQPTVKNISLINILVSFSLRLGAHHVDYKFTCV